MPFLAKPAAKITIRKSLRAKGFHRSRAAGSGGSAGTGGFDRLDLKRFIRKIRKKGIPLFSGETALCSRKDRISNKGRISNKDRILNEDRSLNENRFANEGGSLSNNCIPDENSVPDENRQAREGGSLNAGMTVEASLVLPLFLFFTFNVLFLFDVIRLQSSVTAALQQTGDRICEYAWYREYAAGGGEEGIQIPQAAGDVLSLAYVSGEVRNHLGSGYMNSTCLRGGSGGISYLNSRVLSGNDIVEINADYRTRPFIPVLSGPDFSIRSTYYGHAWTGYEIGSGDGGEPGESQTAGDTKRFIVAENGVVYHTDPDCVYLKPHVREADASDLGHLRANDGSIYHPCEYCHPSPNGKVYITPDGNRYHSSPDCSRITRTTHEETAEEAQSHLRPCPKCGGAH